MNIRGPGALISSVLGYLLLPFVVFIIGLVMRADEVPIAAQVLITVALAGLLVVTWRLGRVGVYVRGRDVKVINPLRTISLASSHIAEFQLDQTEIPLFHVPVSVGTAFLTNGCRIRLWSLMLRDPPLPIQLRKVLETLAGLNQFVAPPRRAK